MCVTRYLLDNELLCAVGLYELHHEGPGCSALRLHWNDIMVVLYEVIFWLCFGYVVVMLWLLLWQLHQLGERLCYGCHANQERIKGSVIPRAPHISIQPLSLRLAYPRFSKR